MAKIKGSSDAASSYFFDQAAIVCLRVSQSSYHLHTAPCKLPEGCGDGWERPLHGIDPVKQVGSHAIYHIRHPSISYYCIKQVMWYMMFYMCCSNVLC